MKRLLTSSITTSAALLAAVLGLSPARAEENGNLEALRQAATAGDTAAQYELGVLYEFGYHMPANLVPAYVWYTAAAEGGDVRATDRREVVRSQLKPAEIEEAERMKGQLLAATPAMPSAAAPEPAPSEPAPPAAAAPVETPAAVPATAPAAEPAKPYAASFKRHSKRSVRHAHGSV